MTSLRCSFSKLHSGSKFGTNGIASSLYRHNPTEHVKYYLGSPFYVLSPHLRSSFQLERSLSHIWSSHPTWAFDNLIWQHKKAMLSMYSVNIGLDTILIIIHFCNISIIFNLRIQWYTVFFKNCLFKKQCFLCKSIFFAFNLFKFYVPIHE